jgi:DNA-binding transcriptional LysR family regulator
MTDINKVTMLQIDYFLAVAERLSFTNAARDLYTSQPSISKQISLLEESVGVRLFYRTKRSVRLTAAGEHLCDALRGIHTKIDCALADAAEVGGVEDKTLVVGLFSVMNTGFLTKFLEQFREAHPDIVLNFEMHSWRRLRERFLKGDIDFILSFDFEMIDCPNIDTRKIKTFNSCILISRMNPLSQKQDLKLADLVDQDFVLIDRNESSGGHDSVIKLCKANGFTPRVAKTCENIESMILAVQSDRGVAIMDNMDRGFSNTNIAKFEIEDDFLDLIGAWKTDNRKPVLLVFRDELSEYLSAKGVY